MSSSAADDAWVRHVAPGVSGLGCRLRAWKILGVSLAGAAVIEHPSSEQGDHISGAAGLRHLGGAEALIAPVFMPPPSER